LSWTAVCGAGEGLYVQQQQQPPPTAPFPDLPPDLLHPAPVTRIDLEATRLAIALAFASGVSGGLFADALVRERPVPPELRLDVLPRADR
jgi:hypothetical protein